MLLISALVSAEPTATPGDAPDSNTLLAQSGTPNGDDSAVARPTFDIPEPASLVLLGTGVAVVIARRRRSVQR